MVVKFLMKTNITYLFVFVFITFTSILTYGIKDTDPKEKFVVVLDAGHGGKDPGKNPPKGLKEKDIALNIALAIGKELEKNEDIEVIYTRKKDVFVELFERGKIANQADADLFVSIHCNAHNSQAYGSETYVLGVHRNKTNFEVAKAENEVIYLEDNYETKYDGFDPNSPESVIGLTLMQEEYLDQSILLAKEIEDSFSGTLKRKSRGVKYAGFIVLHQTYMPSVLVETGFVTNKKEGAYLNSKKGQAQIAQSIAKSITNYKNRLDQNVGSSFYEIETTEDFSESSEIYEGITFKVQIAAGSKKLEAESYNFNGLVQISRESNGNLYRYFSGSTSDYSEIKRIHTKAKSKGYSTSFIVAYRDGVKISLNEALKTNAN